MHIQMELNVIDLTIRIMNPYNALLIDSIPESSNAQCINNLVQSLNSTWKRLKLWIFNIPKFIVIDLQLQCVKYFTYECFAIDINNWSKTCRVPNILLSNIDIKTSENAFQMYFTPIKFSENLKWEWSSFTENGST